MTDILPILYGFGELVFAIVLLSILRCSARAKRKQQFMQGRAAVARLAHNQKVGGSTPSPATNFLGVTSADEREEMTSSREINTPNPEGAFSDCESVNSHGCSPATVGGPVKTASDFEDSYDTDYSDEDEPKSRVRKLKFY